MHHIKPKRGTVTYQVSGNTNPNDSQAIVIIPKLVISLIIQILRVYAGGELSTDRPCRFPMLVRVMLYGAISLIASFTFRCRLTWSQSIRSTLSCPDSSLSLSRCATLLRRRIGRSIWNGLTWEVARHYNDAVHSSPYEHTAAPRSRQAPLAGGFVVMGLA